MNTITIPKVRIGNDLLLDVKLKAQSGSAISWADVDNIYPSIYSDSQRVNAGDCIFRIDEDDNTLLHVCYPASEPQYIGVARLTISFDYSGISSTVDAPVADFVPQSAAVVHPNSEVPSSESGSYVITASLSMPVAVTSDYKHLYNRPSINGHVLEGNKPG